MILVFVLLKTKPWPVLAMNYILHYARHRHLNLAIQYFIKLASLENSSLKMWTNTESNMLNAHSTLLIPCDQHALRLTEWSQNMLLTSMVRMFTGKKWSPSEMAFQPNLPIGNYVREKFPNTRFLTGQKSAWVSLPISLLSLPLKKIFYRSTDVY